MTMELKIGDKAPDFSGQISEQKTLTLADFRDQYLVLYFYPKDSTPGCTIEAKDFAEREMAFKELSATVVGVSKDSLKSHANFKDKCALDFDLISDKEGEVCAKYGVWVEKSMFGKKYMGIQRATFLIDPQGNIAHIWPSVSVKNHAQQVLDKIKDLSD